MANFSESNLLTAQAMLNDKAKKPENRFKPSPTIQLGLSNLPYLMPDHGTLRTREDRAVKAYLLGKSVRTAGTARSATHTGNRGVSIEQTLTWAVYSDKFSISLKQMDNNLFGFNMTLAQQLENAMKNCLIAAETYEIGQLQTNRSQVNIATSGGTFNAGQNAFEVATAGNLYWAKMRSMMRQNYYEDGNFDVITNSSGKVNFDNYAAQGGSNATNLAYQAMGLNVVESVELADANYPTSDVSLIMPSGVFAVLPWIPKQNRQGYGGYASYLGGFGTIQDPWGLGITFAVHGYASRVDTSASNGNVQDNLFEFEVSIDMAHAVAPLSTANESPVFEVVGV